MRRPTVSSQSGMRKTLGLAGSVACSSLLGWMGSRYGFMTSFMLGMVGSGLGLYGGRRLADHLEG